MAAAQAAGRWHGTGNGGRLGGLYTAGAGRGSIEEEAGGDRDVWSPATDSNCAVSGRSDGSPGDGAHARHTRRVEQPQRCTNGLLTCPAP
jgi:hypothetical protein